MSRQLLTVFAIVTAAPMFVLSQNISSASAPDDGDCVHVRHLIRLALRPMTDNNDDRQYKEVGFASKTFQLELDDPASTTYTIQVARQPSPIWPSTRYVVMDGNVVESDEPASKYARRIYAGYVSEAPDSSVVGTFHDGIFQGVVYLDDNSILFVEPSSDVVGFNAVAYWSRDIVDARSDKEVVASHRLPKSHWIPLPAENSIAYQGVRSKRAAKATTTTTAKPDVSRFRLDKTFFLCNLSVVADHLYYKHYAGSDIESVFREVEANIFYADDHFRYADINEDKSSDGFGFRVSKLTVLKQPSTIEEFKSDKADTYDSYQQDALFREMFGALESFNEYCAGLFFTYRLASTDDSGITQVKVRFTHDIRSHGFCSKSLQGDLIPLGALKDYTKYLTNALPVNFYFKGGKANPQLGIASSVHQLGHLFHASDDSDTADKSCQSKNFFMTTPISEVHKGSQFSTCSLRDMNTAIMRKKKTDIYCVFACVLHGDNCRSSDFPGGITTRPMTTRGRGATDDLYPPGSAASSWMMHEALSFVLVPALFLLSTFYVAYFSALYEHV